MAPNFLLYLFLVAGVMTTALGLPAAAGGAGRNSTDFIRSSCGATLYPKLCLSSLAGYARSIQHDPIRLARAAADVSLARVRALSAHVAALRQASAGAGSSSRGFGQGGTAALRDCADALASAVDLAGRSSAELGRLKAAEGPEVAWRVSNAQTWMSAVLTNEETCIDGFGPYPQPDAVASGGHKGSIKDDVCGKVRTVKAYSSNALALVNHLVAGRR